MRYGWWMVLWLAPTVVATPNCEAASQLVINEFMASPGRDWNSDGTVSSRDDEWVEVYNTGETPVILDGYRLADSDTSWRYGFSGTLPGHGRLVVFGAESYAWEKATRHSALGLSLNNTGDVVRLWKFSGTDSMQVDSYAYNSVEGGSDRSVGRFPDGGATWRVFDSLNPIPAGGAVAGTACAPTPTSPNGCPTLALPVSWGLLRMRYGPRPVPGSPGRLAR